MLSIGVSDEMTDSIETATKSHDKLSCADLRHPGRGMIGDEVPAEPASSIITTLLNHETASVSVGESKELKRVSGSLDEPHHRFTEEIVSLAESYCDETRRY